MWFRLFTELCLWKYLFRSHFAHDSQATEISEHLNLLRALEGHLVQLHLPLDQAAHSPIQPDLERFQGWGIQHLSGQPVPLSHHPYCKKLLPFICSKEILF